MHGQSGVASAGVNGGVLADGRPARAGETPRSVRIASGGFRTTTEIKRFGSALATDIMTERVGHKPANGAIRSLLMTLRTAETEARYGGRPIAIDDGLDGPEPPADPLELRRAELLEELAHIDKERAAKCSLPASGPTVDETPRPARKS